GGLLDLDGASVDIASCARCGAKDHPHPIPPPSRGREKIEWGRVRVGGWRDHDSRRYSPLIPSPPDRLTFMFTTRPEILGSFGCVASTPWLARSAGMAVLEGGGNAFDAAVAAGFVLQVVEPHLNGPGGE